MFNLHSVIIAFTLAAPALLTSGMANAITVTGNSGGTFANIANCGGASNCRINNTSNGNATQLEWGYQNGNNGSPGSTLTAVDRNWNVATNANDVILAELVWFNRPTADNTTPDSFSANYFLSLIFSNPNASNDQEVFNLNITNPTNPTGDSLSGLLLADLAGLSFSLNGVTVTDLKYLLNGGVGSTFNSNVWYNPEDTTSRMYITADFTNEVPEPGSLILLAAGLFSVSMLRRRQKH
jgi:hypothetical protein